MDPLTSFQNFLHNKDRKLTPPPEIMLNAKALSHLLTENVHPILYPKWFTITPAGTLIAYSTPASTTELRHQAALVSSTWRDYDARIRTARTQAPPEDPHSTAAAEAAADRKEEGLQALTIETPIATIIARLIQQRLLLVLVAPLPEVPGQQHKERPEFEVHAEGEGDERYPGKNEGSEDESNVETSGANVGMSVLRMQREKVDKGIVMIKEELQKRGFVMPEGVD